MPSPANPNNTNLEAALASIAHDLANAALALETAGYASDPSSLPSLVAHSANRLFEVCGALDTLIGSLGDTNVRFSNSASNADAR